MPPSEARLEEVRAAIQRNSGDPAYYEKISRIKRGDVVELGESWCHIDRITSHQSPHDRRMVLIEGWNVRTEKRCGGMFDPTTYDRIGMYFSKEMVASGERLRLERPTYTQHISHYQIMKIEGDNANIRNTIEISIEFWLRIHEDRLSKSIRRGLPYLNLDNKVELKEAITCSITRETSLVASVHY